MLRKKEFRKCTYIFYKAVLLSGRTGHPLQHHSFHRIGARVSLSVSIARNLRMVVPAVKTQTKFVCKILCSFLSQALFTNDYQKQDDIKPGSLMFVLVHVELEVLLLAGLEKEVWGRSIEHWFGGRGHHSSPDLRTASSFPIRLFSLVEF